MRKFGWILIGIIFIGMLWTILALAVPPIGAGTRTLFLEILGPGIVNGAIGISNTVMAWGASGFPQAMGVFFGIGILWLLMGFTISRLIWPRLPYVHKSSAVVAKETKEPLQGQLQQPVLQQVKQEEATAS